MKLHTTFAALAAGFLIAASAAEAAPVHATSFWALGDSLSDPGNLFAATEAATGTGQPPPPYFEGRFSNGPVWAEAIQGDFAAKGLDTGNYAYGFGQAVTSTDPAKQLIPDLPMQIGLFALDSPDRLGARPVVSLLFGANDLFFDGIGKTNEEGRPIADAVAMRAANAVADGALALAGLGVKDFLVFNLPDLGKTPNYALFQPDLAAEASAATVVFNETLASRIPGLQAAGLHVAGVNLFGLFNELIENPAAFGVANATIPCLVPGVSYCGDAAADLFAFFDPVHPNRIIHGQIADVARTKVAPIPLPAPALLLVAGLAALGFVGRGRAR
jgi:phospholipase/lecithinase/hemolysin